MLSFLWKILIKLASFSCIVSENATFKSKIHLCLSLWRQARIKLEKNQRFESDNWQINGYRIFFFILFTIYQSNGVAISKCRFQTLVCPQFSHEVDVTPPFCRGGVLNRFVEFTGFIFSVLNSNFVFIWKIFLQLVTIPSNYIWQYVVVLFDIFLTVLYDVRVFRGVGVNFFLSFFNFEKWIFQLLKTMYSVVSK